MSLVEFQNLEEQFSSNREFQDFLEAFDRALGKINANMAKLPKSPFFPETLDTVKLCASVSSFEVDSDSAYLSSDYKRFGNLVEFTNVFRDEATNRSIENYRDHFRNSRKGSPASVLEHIKTLPDLHEYRFSRSDGEKSFLELLKLIREKYPTDDESPPR